MIIHQPAMKKKQGEIIISAKIDFTNTVPRLPEQLWFSFPEEYEAHITPRVEAFLLAMLVPAMYYQEDIKLNGPISPRLAYNLKEFMAIYHAAFGLPLIQINYPSLETFLPKQWPTAVTVAFSGGVDSMYTLYKHLPQNQPIVEAQVTHGVLVQGFNDFDIALDDQAYFERVNTRYQKLFARLGLTLLNGKTNAYQFSKFRINWMIPHSPTLVAFAYLLGNLIGRFYRATDGEFVIFGKEDPFTLSNHLLSCETLQVVSHTVTAERAEKLMVLSQWEEAHENLRVCLNWDKTNVSLNCSKCMKCTVTMILLEIIGEYKKFKAFVQPYPWKTMVRFWWSVYSGGSLSFLLIKKYAQKFKRYDILFWFYLLYFPRKVKTWLFDQINRRLSDETKFKIRAKIYRKQDREPVGDQR